MDSASVTVQLTPADLKRFTKFVGLGENRRGLLLLVIVFVLFGASYLMRDPDQTYRVKPNEEAPKSYLSSAISLGWPSFVPVVIFVTLFGYFYWRARRPSAYEAYAPGVFKLNTYEVLERGFLCRSERGEALNYWPVIVRFAETEEDFFVMLAARNGHVLPKRCFPTLEAMAIFKNQMHMYLEKHAPAALARR